MGHRLMEDGAVGFIGNCSGSGTARSALICNIGIFIKQKDD